MIIVEVNSYNYGSTGTIMRSIASSARKKGNTVYLCYPKRRSSFLRYEKNDIWIGNILLRNFWLFLSERLPLTRFAHYFETKRFVSKLKSLHPDVIHIHNLHSSYLNIPIFFNYLANSDAKIVWTLHDCWSFTGHCPHFEHIGCYKWEDGCYSCNLYKEYPYSSFDNSSYMYALKKKCFTKLDNLKIITPSRWLLNYVKRSFLKEFPIEVVNNGIDLSRFHPVKSKFREQNGIGERVLLLGVSMVWDNNKGLDVFVELGKRLPQDKFSIVLVGTDDAVDDLLPSNIISIHRTHSVDELIEIYSAADAFINPTRIDTFPTVNIEALACGTPVITYDTGGSPEIIDDKSGIVTESKTVESTVKAICKIGRKTRYIEECCIRRSQQFSLEKMAEKYIAIFQE